MVCTTTGSSAAETQICRSLAASLCTDDQTGGARLVESVGIGQSRRRRDSHRAFAVREREDHLLGVVWDASEKRVVREHGIVAVHTDAADVVRHHAIHEPLV
jgi:ribulose-5-phosphate 4-epimerase/fuculose-1-phosphate aldolase